MPLGAELAPITPLTFEHYISMLRQFKDDYMSITKEHNHGE